MLRHHLFSIGTALRIATLVTLVHGSSLAQETRKTPAPKLRDTQGSAYGSPEAFEAPSARITPGFVAPDFELDSSLGKRVRLSSLRGDWVVLVFEDRLHPLTTLQAIDTEMRHLGVRVVAVCREKTNRVRNLAGRDQLTFLVLADATGEVSSLYGLRDHAQAETRPAIVVLDRRGRVKMSMMGQSLPAAEIARLTKYVVKGA